MEPIKYRLVASWYYKNIIEKDESFFNRICPPLIFYELLIIPAFVNHSSQNKNDPQRYSLREIVCLVFTTSPVSDVIIGVVGECSIVKFLFPTLV